MKTARPAAEACSSGSMARISRQLAVTLTAKTSSQAFGSTWPSGESGPRMPALPIRMSKRPAEPIDAGIILQVQRHEGGGTAVGADRVVDFLEPAHGARHRDHVRTGPPQRERGRGPDAARSAGDERDAIGERLGHEECIPCSSSRGRAKRATRDPRTPKESVLAVFMDSG